MSEGGGLFPYAPILEGFWIFPLDSTVDSFIAHSSVTWSEHKPLGSALRRFSTKMKKSGVLRAIRGERFYEVVFLLVRRWGFPKREDL